MRRLGTLIASLVLVATVVPGAPVSAAPEPTVVGKTVIGQSVQGRPIVAEVLIDGADGRRVARLYLASRELVAEFDAAAPEVRLMTDGVASRRVCGRREWDAALAGHSREQRAAAEVFTLAL